MFREVRSTTNDGNAARARGRPWAAYAAATWAIMFAAMSCYWAAGGTIGLSTLSPALLAMRHDPSFLAVVWATGVLKGLAGVLVLALVQPWGRHFPLRLRIAAAWSIGGFMVLYAGANLIVRALMALGILDAPASMNAVAAQWHLLFWDPWWLLGGLLFCLAAWAAGRFGGCASQ